MILAIFLIVLAAAMFVLHLFVRKNEQKLFACTTESRDAAAKPARLAHIMAMIRNAGIVLCFVFLAVIILVNINYRDQQISDRQQIKRYEKIIEKRTEQAEAMCGEFSMLLGKVYPEHEKKLFGKITPENIKVYYARFPGIQSNKTAVALVGKVSNLQGECYKLRDEREAVLATMRYRSENPWLFSSMVGEPLREGNDFGLWFLGLATLFAIPFAIYGRRSQKRFWMKVSDLGIESKVSLEDDKYRSNAATCGFAWFMFGVASVVAAAILLIGTAIYTGVSWSEQIADKHTLAQIGRQAVIAKEKADKLSPEFKRILVEDYQAHETEIFDQFAPKNVLAYFASYPEFRSADTIIALVGQMNALFGDYYDKEVEQQVVIARIRYRERSPWVVQSAIPSAETMLAEAAAEIDGPVTIQPDE